MPAQTALNEHAGRTREKCNQPGSQRENREMLFRRSSIARKLRTFLRGSSEAKKSFPRAAEAVREAKDCGTGAGPVFN